MGIKKIIFAGLLLLTVLLLAGMQSVLADEAPPLSPEDRLLALINQARQNPLDVAASLGMSQEKILADFPGMESILQDGISPLTTDERLAQAATSHTADMFDRGYYADVSPDGIGHEERIKNAGYSASVSGETLGMIIFGNFINTGDAVNLIFRYMLQDELDPSRTAKRNILDPCLKEVGISVKSGTIILGGARWNVYLATCDFGAVLSCLEEHLFQLINQTRENPRQVAGSLFMNPDQVLANSPVWQTLSKETLMPLQLSINLSETARVHARDMLENGYYSHLSLDGRTFYDRIFEGGYDTPYDVGEQIGLWRFCNDDIDEKQATSTIFNNMLKSELTSDMSAGQCTVLNPSFTEVGIGVITGHSPGLGVTCGDYVELVVLDFGSGQEIAVVNP